MEKLREENGSGFQLAHTVVHGEAFPEMSFAEMLSMTERFAPALRAA